MNTITSIISISTTTRYNDGPFGSYATCNELELLNEETGEIIALIEPKISYIRQNYRVGDGPCPYSICMETVDFGTFEFSANSDLVEKVLDTFSFRYEDAEIPF